MRRTAALRHRGTLSVIGSAFYPRNHQASATDARCGGYKPENHPFRSQFQITAPKFTGNPKFAFKPDWDALRTSGSRLESIPVPVAYQS
eukprot:7388134-Prymnesium_polylepis.1